MLQPMPVNSPLQQGTLKDESTEFSLSGLATDIAFGAALGAGIGLAAGGPIGALGGSLEGAIEGGLGYLAGCAAANIAYSLGASQKTQALVNLAATFAVPGGLVAKSRKLATELPQLLKEGLKSATTAAAAGYIGWSLSDEDPRLGMVLGALAGTTVVGLTKAFNMEKTVDQLAAHATRFSTKIPGLRLFREIPEVFVPGKMEGVMPGLGSQVPVGVRDVVKEGLRMGIAKQWEAEYMLQKAAQGGMKVFAEENRAITRSFKYGMSVSAFEEFKKGNPGIGEFLDTYVQIVTADTEFMQTAGLIDSDILSAFTYIRRDLDKMKIHVPVVMRVEEETKGMKMLFRKPGEKLVREQSLLKEAGRRARPSKEVLEEIGVGSTAELTPGEQYSFRGHEWSFVRKGKKEYFLRPYTEEEYAEITKESIAKGTAAPGTVVQPDIVAGAIKIASERGNLYKRAWIVNKLERVLSKNNLLGEKPSSVLSVKIPDVKLKDSWGVKAFGRMNGMYTTPDVARALENINALLSYKPGNFAENILGDFTSRWASMTNLFKKYFLGANWRSYLTQGLGDIALCLVNGVNPGTVVSKGLRALSDKEFRLAFERLGGESIGVEHDVIVKGFKYVNGKLVPRSKIESAFAALDMLGDKLIGYFGFTDKVFRAGLVKMYMEEGMTMHSALTKASDVIPTYELIPSGIKTLRDTIFPFISFSYVTLPKIVKAVLTKPHAFLSLLALAEGVQVAAFRELYGDRWREGRRFEKLVNEHYMQPMPGAFLADYIRIPRMGRIPGGYMSVSWLPWNLPVSVPAVTEATRPTFWGAVFFLQHPVLKTVFGLAMNLDPATGRTVYDLAGPGRTWASVAQWGMRNLLPTLPGTGKYALNMFAKEGWFRPLTAWFNVFGVDYAGKPYELEHLVWNQIAPTIKEFDPSYKARVELIRIQQAIEEHKRGLYKMLYRGASPDVMQERLARFREYVGEESEKVRQIASAQRGFSF